jgi:ribosomal protein S18 acetylase RimI-like enzyme
VSSAEQAPSLPAGYTHRPVTLDDVDVVAAMSGRSEAALGLREEAQEPFLRWALALPYVALHRDSVLVERDGDAAAFGGVMRDPAAVGSSLDWFGVVDPGYLGRSLGGWLVTWALGVAAAREPGEGPFEVRTNIPAPDEAAHRLFASRGLTHVRTMWTMHRDLAQATAGPPPAGVTIRTFETGRDERTFWEVGEASFEGHYGHVPSPFESWEAEWYQAHDWNPDAVLLAERDGAVVGELAWIEAGEDGYIASVGVLEAHRGRGIGTALLRAAFADIADAGFASATLGVDTENATGAVGLYRSAGMEPVRESHIFERSRT